MICINYNNKENTNICQISTTPHTKTHGNDILWAAQTEALLDIRVMDTDAQSYTSRTVDSVLLSAENEKKKKYLDAVEARHASFTPFVTSINGVLAHEANSVIKLLATKTALKWVKILSEVTGWVRAALAHRLSMLFIPLYFMNILYLYLFL